METKQSIRNQIYQKRKLADPAQLASASQQICQEVIALTAFWESGWIYTYIDFNNEVSTRAIVETAWKNNKRVAAPKVTGRDLVFYEITSYEQLKPGCFGVPEPEGCQRVNEEEALVIVPGVAFDGHRHRVGYGQGFYDRYLSSHPKHKTAAVAFDFQLFDELPSEEQDILPQILITQSHIYKQEGTVC